MTPWLREALLDTWAVLLPVECAGCGAPDRALCLACLAALAPAPESRMLDGGLRVTSAVRYEGVVRSAILNYKEHGRTDVARALAASLGSALSTALGTGSGAGGGVGGPGSAIAGRVEVCPVPTSRAAFRRRGYDPLALLLRRAGLSWRTGLLVPTRGHARQKALGRAARARNSAGWLRARHPLVGRGFVLVDDVVTTGATLLEAARAIREAGGEVVAAVALASTPRLSPEVSATRPKVVTYTDDRATVGTRGAESRLVPPGDAPRGLGGRHGHFGQRTQPRGH
jgi:ComF family protein